MKLTKSLVKLAKDMGKVKDDKTKRIIILWGAFVLGLVVILITLKFVSPDQLNALSGLFDSILKHLPG